MTVDIKLEITVYLLSINDRRHAISPFIKQSQNRVIHIVVNKNNPFLSTLNQIRHKSIGIINLSIIKHALLRLCIALIQSVEYLINTLVCFFVDVSAFPVDCTQSFPSG